MKLFTLFIFSLTASQVFSQENFSSQIDINDLPVETVEIDFSTMSEDSLTYYTNKFLAESFLNCNEHISNYSSMTKNYVSRIKIIKLNNDHMDGYKNISSIDIKNKCNPSLVHSSFSEFNIKYFNPVKYRIDFLKEEVQLFRLYNSNCIMYVEKYSK